MTSTQSNASSILYPRRLNSPGSPRVPSFDTRRLASSPSEKDLALAVSAGTSVSFKPGLTPGRRHASPRWTTFSRSLDSILWGPIQESKPWRFDCGGWPCTPTAWIPSGRNPSGKGPNRSWRKRAPRSSGSWPGGTESDTRPSRRWPVRGKANQIPLSSVEKVGLGPNWTFNDLYMGKGQ